MIAFLATLAAAVALQQGPATHYRVTLNSSRNVDRTASGEEALGGTYTATAFVTATTTGDGGGRVGHVVIDSVRCTGTGLMSMAFDSVVGKTSRGTVYDFKLGSRFESLPTPSISNTLTNVLAQVALMLFPTIEPGSRVGATWSDSLDTSMGDPANRNRPVITRWTVTALHGDTTMADGQVRGALSSTARVVSSGLVSGSRHLTLVAGMLQMQTSSVTQETLMVGEGATAITRGTGTTVLEIARLPNRAMSP